MLKVLMAWQGREVEQTQWLLTNRDLQGLKFPGYPQRAALASCRWESEGPLTTGAHLVCMEGVQGQAYPAPPDGRWHSRKSWPSLACLLALKGAGLLEKSACALARLLGSLHCLQPEPFKVLPFSGEVEELASLPCKEEAEASSELHPGPG